MARLLEGGCAAHQNKAQRVREVFCSPYSLPQASRSCRSWRGGRTSGVGKWFANKGLVPPKSEQKAISEAAASVAWAGLQSFTGEYNLQVEFPKEAGLVLRRVFGKPSEDGSIEILCADGIVRSFKYKYYDHNGMFRLNVPNSTPLVDWARANKAGIAYVEHDEEPNVLAFEILPPGQRLMDVVDRSLALGTWGRTSTRLYWMALMFNKRKTLRNGVTK